MTQLSGCLVSAEKDIVEQAAVLERTNPADYSRLNTTDERFVAPEYIN